MHCVVRSTARLLLLAGTTVVRKPGYKAVTVNTEVKEEACHVNTRTVRVELATDSLAIRQTPIFHANGARVGGSSASAGIRVFGDTLEIVGGRYSRMMHSGEPPPPSPPPFRAERECKRHDPPGGSHGVPGRASGYRSQGARERGRDFMELRS